MRKKFDKAENWKNTVYIAVGQSGQNFEKIIEISEAVLFKEFEIKENKSGKTFITGNFDGAEFYKDKAYYSPIKIDKEELIDICVNSYIGNCFGNYKVISEKEAEKMKRKNPKIELERV